MNTITMYLKPVPGITQKRDKLLIPLWSLSFHCSPLRLLRVNVDLRPDCREFNDFTERRCLWYGAVPSQYAILQYIYAKK